MPRKKRTLAPEVSAVPELPQLPTLTQEELLRLRLLSAEERLSTRDAQILAWERNAYLAKIDPKGVLESFSVRIQKAAELSAESSREYTKHLDAVGARLGINLREGYLIDPDTGVATRVDNPKKE